MDYIRLETNNRKYCKCSLAEEGKFLDIPLYLAIRLVAAEIAFIVYEIVMYAFIVILHDTNVNMIGHKTEVHIEAGYIVEMLTVLPRDTHILRNYNSDIKLVFVEHFGQRSDYISKTACFDKRVAL